MPPPTSSTHRPYVVAAIMASMFMIAIEATIVSTAMPQIVADLGGLDIYSWVFASFLLTQTATTVVFGKLADVYGRKPVMLTGIAIFLAGSIMAGFAWSMPSMIVFRLIQGIGAGCVQPVAMTIVADLYSPRERGKVQGHLASVWAFSAVAGPLAGGAIIHHFAWSWVFWLNIPVGLAAAAGYVFFLHEDVQHKSPSIDIAGAVFFAIAIGALMFALNGIGSAYRAQSLWAFATFAIASALFFWQERRAADPMVSFALWSKRPIAVANAVAVLASMALMGLTTFLPMYVQAVLHRSPIVAGFALTTMLVGWPVGATIAARSMDRIGLRRIFLAGSLCLPAGAACFALLTPDSSPLLAAIGSAIMGFGMGLTTVCGLMLIQEVAHGTQRGSATASAIFARNLGSTLGAAVLGAVLNIGLTHAAGDKAVTAEQLRKLLDQGVGLGGIDQGLVAALASAMHLMFVVMFGLTVVLAGVARLGRTLRLHARGFRGRRCSARGMKRHRRAVPPASGWEGFCRSDMTPTRRRTLPTHSPTERSAG